MRLRGRVLVCGVEVHMNERIEIHYEGRVLELFGAFDDAVAASLDEMTPAWPLPHERAHQDALWFCSGGDQLL